jgi:hypothetical protein
MECSGGKSDFDFWKVLVDYQDATEKLIPPIKNNSFISFRYSKNSVSLSSDHSKMMIA